MEQKAVSVVIPVYGVEKYIQRTLRSLAKQTFQDFEIILVDDGSIDRSVEIAETFLQTTSLCWRTLHQKNQGQGPARDFGISQAIGKYVICVDSDDTVAPDFLKTLWEQAENSKSDLCFCGYKMVDEKTCEDYFQDTVSYKKIEKQELLRLYLLRKMTPILPTMLVRRGLMEQKSLQAPKGCRFSEDVYLIWLIFSAADRISYSNEPLYNYLCRPGSTMTASSAARILTGYEAFCGIGKDSRLDRDFVGKDFLLPRWVLGALRSAARITDYEQFCVLAQKMDYRLMMKRLHRFPEIKAQILSRAATVNLRLFYWIVRAAG